MPFWMRDFTAAVWNMPPQQVFILCPAQPGVQGLKSNDYFREYFILKASE